MRNVFRIFASLFGVGFFFFLSIFVLKATTKGRKTIPLNRNFGIVTENIHYIAGIFRRG